MKASTKKVLKSYVLPGFLIALLGFVFLALSFAIYFLAVMAIESAFYANNPQDIPMDGIRAGMAALSALVFIIIYLIKKIPDWIKASMFVGALGAVLITAVLSFYTRVYIFLPLTLGLAAIFIVLFIVFKKPWYYPYATLLALFLALLYAWPE